MPAENQLIPFLHAFSDMALAGERSVDAILFLVVRPAAHVTNGRISELSGAGKKKIGSKGVLVR